MADLPTKERKESMEKTKLDKYREERARYLAKIAAYQKRVRALEQKIMEGENLEIRALMKEESLTLEELMAMVKRMQEQRRDGNKPDAPDKAESGAGMAESALSADMPHAPEAKRPSSGYEPPYDRPAYAATFNDLEDENE